MLGSGFAPIHLHSTPGLDMSCKVVGFRSSSDTVGDELRALPSRGRDGPRMLTATPALVPRSIVDTMW